MNLTYSTFPDTVTPRDIQRSYSQVFDRVSRSHRPLVVLANNQPKVAIISLKMLQEYQKLLLSAQLMSSITAVRQQNDKTADSQLALTELDQAIEAIRQNLYGQA